MSKIQWYWCVITKILIRGNNSSQSALYVPAAGIGGGGWRNNWFKSFHLTNLLIIHFLHEGTVWIIRWNWEIASVWRLRKWWRIPQWLSIQVINWLYRFLFLYLMLTLPVCYTTFIWDKKWFLTYSITSHHNIFNIKDCTDLAI